MEIYSEYMDGDRKATVTRLRRGWDSTFDVWEVAMYIAGKPIQRTTTKREDDAEQIAEDFVQSGSQGATSLLQENIING
jgi:hypothetical protein